MANISSFFGGSGGGGTAADPTLNTYGVPLPQYIKCYAYKDTCVETQGVSSVCCGGFIQGGIVPLHGNAFMALAVEMGRSSDSDCGRLYAKAYCIDDSTGDIYSGQTAYTLVFTSNSSNARVGYEQKPRAISDGCKNVYVPIGDNSHDRLLKICANTVEGPSSIGTSTICASVATNSTLTYSGDVGTVVWQSRSDHPSCACIIRITNGSVAFCNSLGFDNCNIRCGSSGGTPSCAYMCALNTDYILQVGYCNSSNCYCTRSRQYLWNPANSSYNVDACSHGSTDYVSSQAWSKTLSCNFNVPGILQRAIRMGPGFYSPGQNAAWFNLNQPTLCDYFTEERVCFCTGCGYTHNQKLYFNPTGTWNIEADFHNGCLSGSKTDCNSMKGVQKINVTPTPGACWEPSSFLIQANGVRSSGLFSYARGKCTDCEFRQNMFTSFEVEQDISKLSSYTQIPIFSYGNPNSCRLFTNEPAINNLGSAVVGKKWVVSMETSRTGTCECIAVHSYKIMTNSCTAD